MKKFYFLSALLLSVVLFSSCKKGPEALFSMDKSSVPMFSKVSFENQSTDATSYSWDFGDGEQSSEENPTHEYAKCGTFTVTLTATGDGDNHSYSAEVTVTPSMTGEWEVSLYIFYSQLNMNADITQHENNSLSGTFTRNDGLDLGALLSTSNIQGSYVTMDWAVDSDVVSLCGSVNSDYDQIFGEFKVNGIHQGQWSAKRIQ